MDNIKQIKKEFHQCCKELAWHFKQFYKTNNDDIEYFLCINMEYDYLVDEYQEELEQIVFKHEEFFKLVNKCKRNLEKIEIFNVCDTFTKKELSLHSEMTNILKDIEFRTY